jgi:hypothetical protein
MCRLLGVNSHNYYSYQERQTDKPEDLTHQLSFIRVEITLFRKLIYITTFKFVTKCKLLKDLNTARLLSDT